MIDLNIQLRINYSLKIFKMMVVLFQGMYFLSAIWFIYCDQILQYYSQQDPETSFLVQYNMVPFEGVSLSFIAIKLMYYTETTLSTVGFGDMVPKSSAEYVMFCFVMVLSVATTSYVIGLFKDVIFTFRSIDQEHDHSDYLNNFFFIMTEHFNNG